MVRVHEKFSKQCEGSTVWFSRVMLTRKWLPRHPTKVRRSATPQPGHVSRLDRQVSTISHLYRIHIVLQTHTAMTCSLYMLTRSTWKMPSFQMHLIIH